MCERNSDSGHVNLLSKFGFSPSRKKEFEQLLDCEENRGMQPGRVVFSSREIYRLITATGEFEARVSGSLRRQGDLPVVGDWVAFTRSGGSLSVRTLLSRTSSLSRKVPGEVTREQIVAANLDTVFLVMGLDGDFNLRRFERLAVMAWESGAQPVGVLTKADLTGDPAAARLDAQMVMPGAPVYAVSSHTGVGLDALQAFLTEASTVALIGSSGAGKSTLLNALCGEQVMTTAAVRASDSRGRHTTTHRQLVPLPAGGLLVDNPGIREVQLWAEEGTLSEAFDDIEGLAQACRFRDCRHEDEPGCAVLEAMHRGELDASRFTNWQGLQKELQSLEKRRDVATRRLEDRRLGRFYKRVLAEKSRYRGD